MSFCKDCTEHPTGFIRSCNWFLLQFTDEHGNVVSKYLICPRFVPIENPNNWRQFLDGAYS